MDATRKPTTARLKRLSNDRYKVICDVRDLDNRPCNAPLGFMVRQRTLLDDLTSGQPADARSDMLREYARMDIGGWSDDHLAVDNVPLPGPSWRLMPPPSDPRDPSSDAAYRWVEDGVYEPVKPKKQYNPAKQERWRARRTAPRYLDSGSGQRRIRGHFPEPPVDIVCPHCGRRVHVEALNQADP